MRDGETKAKDLSTSFIFSEKATKVWIISTADLTGATQDKSKVEISQNFVTFSEYMNFTKMTHF